VDSSTTCEKPLHKGETPVRRSPKAKPVNTCGCGELAAPDLIGPFIRFTGYLPETNCCTYTVMCAAKPSVCEVPILAWSSGAASPNTLDAIFLDNYCDWNFWRFELSIPLEEDQQTIQYWINADKQEANTFYIPGTSVWN
jgi:hypothetical protein